MASERCCNATRVTRTKHDAHRHHRARDGTLRRTQCSPGRRWRRFDESEHHRSVCTSALHAVAASLEGAGVRGSVPPT